MMIFPNEMDDFQAKEENKNNFAYLFIKWNCHKMVIDHFMIVYWLKCIFKPNCCKNRALGWSK